MYIRQTETGPEQYSIERLVQDNPNVSFPASPSIELLESFGIYQVIDKYPHGILDGFKAVPRAITKAGPDWVQAYDVVPMTPAELDALIPISVTMRQARLALLQTGKLAAVDAAIANIEDPSAKSAAQIEWEYAQTVDRTSPWVQSLTVALGISDAELQNLFKLAATL